VNERESVQGWSRDFNNISMEVRNSDFWQYSVMASSRRWNEVASRYSRLWWWLSDASEYRECRIKCRAFALMISCEFVCIHIGMGHPEASEWSGLWNSQWTVSRFNLSYLRDNSYSFDAYTASRSPELRSGKSAPRHNSMRRDSIQVKSIAWRWLR